MEFRLVRKTELNQVEELYKSVKNTPYCTWNDNYPTMEDIKNDFENRGLYILINDNKIVGALSCINSTDLDDFKCWKVNDETQKELSRICVNPEEQGNGLAKIMLHSIEAILLDQGCHSIHLLVAIKNIPAIKLYSSLGFVNKGNANLYNIEFILLEKDI